MCMTSQSHLCVPQHFSELNSHKGIFGFTAVALNPRVCESLMPAGPQQEEDQGSSATRGDHGKLLLRVRTSGGRVAGVPM